MDTAEKRTWLYLAADDPRGEGAPEVETMPADAPLGTVVRFAADRENGVFWVLRRVKARP